MKAKPVKYIEGSGYVDVTAAEATHLLLHLPGPSGQMHLPVQIGGTRAGTGNWSWNGDCEKPTVRPSVLIRAGHYAAHFDKERDTCWCKYNAEHPGETPVFHCFQCHTWINDGVVQFLGDCTHELAGQSLPLLDL